MAQGPMSSILVTTWIIVSHAHNTINIVLMLLLLLLFYYYQRWPDDDYYLRRRRLCFWFRLFVCLSVCLSVTVGLSDNWKSYERILTNFFGGVGYGPGTNDFNFGDDPYHRPHPGVRSPKSAFTGLSKNLPTTFDDFFGDLGCGLETNWLHFGDDPRHYPDPGVRSGSRSGSGKNWRSAEVCASEYF